jgi:hypothetical protein
VGKYWYSTRSRIRDFSKTPDWAAKPVTVPYANFGNPQSLNLYAYVENNPTTLGDPDGHQGNQSHADAAMTMNCNDVGANACKQPWSTAEVAEDANKSAQNTTQQNQPKPGQEHSGEPYSAKPLSVDTRDPIAKVYTYQIVDPSGKPIQGRSFLTENVTKVFEIGEHDVKTGKNVPIENGRFTDSVGQPHPSQTGHDYLKTEQTFSVVQNGKTYNLTTKVDLYVSVTNGKVTSERDVIVP